MSTITILENDYATLWYHPEAKIVHHQFHRFIYGEKFRAVLDKGIEIFREHGAKKWLSDDRNNSAIPKEDGEWALNDWNPRVTELGWKYWAVVMPDKLAGQKNLDWFMRENIAKGLVVQAFEDPEEAIKWLESVE